MSTRTRSPVAHAALCVGALLTGCAPQAAPYSVELIDADGLSHSALVVREINGSYGAGCPNPGASWSLCVSCEGVLTNPPLSLPSGETGCVLSVSSLRVETGQGSALYVAEAEIPVSSMYAEFGTEFLPNSASADPIYVNIRIEPGTDSASSSNIQVAYSSTPSEVARMSLDTARTTSVAAAGIPAPDYTIDLRDLTVWFDVHRIVQAAEGRAVLLAQRTPGTEYVVLKDDLGPSPGYERVDAAFQRGLRQAITTPNPSLAAHELALLGEDLTSPRVRTIIASNGSAGVRSYRVIAVSFRGP